MATRHGDWAAVVLLAASGCATVQGPVGFVGVDPTSVSTKLLVPHAVGRSCRTWIFGVPLAAGEPSVDEAVRVILGRDAEGDVVTSGEIRWRAVTIGIYNRRCVEVRGDLGRLISTMVLPMPREHGGH